MKKQPTLDPKQFRHKTPLTVLTERFMMGEHRRLLREGKDAGLRGGALAEWVKLNPAERRRVLEAQRRIQRSIAPISTTQTGRLSSRGPNVQNIPRGQRFVATYIDDIKPPRELTPAAAQRIVDMMRKEYDFIDKLWRESRVAVADK